MNNLSDKIDLLIMNSMKNGDKIRTETLRSLKTGFIQWKTRKDNVGKELNTNIELNIIRKLIDSYKETADSCNDGKHDELINNAIKSAEILQEFLPSAPTENDIINVFLKLTETIEPIKKNMGLFIKTIKDTLPGVDGKTVSEIVKSKLV